MVQTTEEFIAQLRAYDDDTLEAVAVMFFAVTARRPQTTRAQQAVRAELKRRHMSARVARLVAEAEASTQRLLAERRIP